MARPKNPSESIVSQAHEYDIITSRREIFLHSYFDGEEESGVDYRVANRFLKNIKILESISDEPIVIHQQSVGGDWEAGMFIYDSLVASPWPIIFI